jgi:hypothetical protein
VGNLGVAFEHVQHSLGFDIPQLHRAIIAGRFEKTAIAGKSNGTELERILKGALVFLSAL